MGVTAVDAERQTGFLLAAAAVLLPLQIWPQMPLSGMQLSDALFALAFARFALARLEAPPATVAVPVAAFAAGAAVSALFGGSAVKLLGHFMLAAVGWMAACASPDTARLLRRALVIAAALAALTALAGVALYFAGLAGYDGAGLPTHPLLYLHGSLETDAYPRPRGTLVTGAMLTAVVSTGALLLWFEPRLVPQPSLRGLIHAIAAIALVFAFSRTIVTFAVVLAGAEILRRESPWWARAGFVLVAVAYAAALWISIRYDVVLNPVRPWEVEVLAAESLRFSVWQSSVGTLLEHPLVGAGPGVPVGDGWTAHNTWLNLWAGLGIVPLVAFAFLMLASVRAAVRAGSAGLAAALVFALVESTHHDVEDMRHLWILFGLALGAASRGASLRLGTDASRRLDARRS